MHLTFKCFEFSKLEFPIFFQKRQNLKKMRKNGRQKLSDITAIRIKSNNIIRAKPPRDTWLQIKTLCLV